MSGPRPWLLWMLLLVAAGAGGIYRADRMVWLRGEPFSASWPEQPDGGLESLIPLYTIALRSTGALTMKPTP